MYSLFLHSHSILRWVALALALITTIKYVMGWFSNQEFNSIDNKLGLFFMISMDVQLLTGIVLYVFLSPLTNTFAINMNDPISRFWGVEHVSMMVIAVAFAHVGRTLVKKGTDSGAKFRRGGILFLLSLLFMLAAIPWPMRAPGIGRPLF